MHNSRYRWVIVAAGGLLGCIAIGAMFSLPVFLRPISQDTGWSVTGVSSAMTIGFLSMAAASIAWGSLSDRLGARMIVLIGSVILAGSLLSASRATSLIEFQIVFGLLVGAATAAIFAPMMACVTGWFDTHRSLAVSLVSAGMGMAPMTMSPLAAWLVSIYDWRTALQIIAVIVAAVMIPTTLLVRRPPVQEDENTASAMDSGPQSSDVGQPGRPVPAIHRASADELFLLRHPFGPDLPYGELRGHLRHPDDSCRFDLQRRRARGHGRPRRLRPARGPVRSQAHSGSWDC